MLIITSVMFKMMAIHFMRGRVCMTHTLEGCKSESLIVYDHESTQMGDIAFVLESSRHMTVPQLPNPHSETGYKYSKFKWRIFYTNGRWKPISNNSL